jgi:1,4-dihydroxy-2-naphthoate octaprenyltransferase
MYRHGKEIRRLKRMRGFGMGGAILLGAVVGFVVGEGLFTILALAAMAAFSWWAGMSNEISDRERGRIIHGRRNPKDRR